MRAIWLVLVMTAGAALAQQNPAATSGSASSSGVRQPAPQPVTPPQPGTTAVQPMATPGGQQQQPPGAAGTQPLPGGAVIMGGYGPTLVQTDGGGDTSTLSGPGPNVSTGPTVGSGPEVGAPEVGADAGIR
jgi:hypothetical protein